MGRLCERCRRHVFLPLAAKVLFDYCHAMFIGCWLCAASRVFVCFVACVCTACAPMFAIQFRCCDPWLPRGRGAVILHAGVVLWQVFVHFREALIAFMNETQCVCAHALARSSS